MIKVDEKTYKNFDELFADYKRDIQAVYTLEKLRFDVRTACFETYLDVDEEDERRIQDAAMALITAAYETSIKYDSSAKRKANKMRELGDGPVIQRK